MEDLDELRFDLSSVPYFCTRIGQVEHTTRIIVAGQFQVDSPQAAIVFDQGFLNFQRADSLRYPAESDLGLKVKVFDRGSTHMVLYAE